VLARQRPQGVVEARTGEDDPRVGQGRLGEEERDVVVERPLDRLDVVPGHDAGARDVVSRDAVVLGRGCPPVGDREELRDVALVFALEHDDPLATGRVACDTDHVGDRLARREGELPVGEPPAPGELLRDMDRVLGGELELHAAAQPPLDRLDHRRARVS
jgi:hypothetical protein